MNAEQKQRAIKLIAGWRAVFWRDAGNDMAALLQELIDAPEPKPVGYTNETELDYVRKYEALPVSGVFWPTSDEDANIALYTAPPAPSVPDADLVRDAERYRWLRNDGAGFDISVAEIDDDGHESWVHGYPPEELDAAIDAAIAAEKGGAE